MNIDECRMMAFCRFKMTERSDCHHSAFVNRPSSFLSTVDIYIRLCDIAILNFFSPDLVITQQPEVMHGS